VVSLDTTFSTWESGVCGFPIVSFADRLLFHAKFLTVCSTPILQLHSYEPTSLVVKVSHLASQSCTNACKSQTTLHARERNRGNFASGSRTLIQTHQFDSICYWLRKNLTVCHTDGWPAENNMYCLRTVLINSYWLVWCLNSSRHKSHPTHHTSLQYTHITITIRNVSTIESLLSRKSDIAEFRRIWYE